MLTGSQPALESKNFKKIQKMGKPFVFLAPSDIFFSRLIVMLLGLFDSPEPILFITRRASFVIYCTGNYDQLNLEN